VTHVQIVLLSELKNLEFLFDEIPWLKGKSQAGPGQWSNIVNEHQCTLRSLKPNFQLTLESAGGKHCQPISLGESQASKNRGCPVFEAPRDVLPKGKRVEKGVYGAVIEVSLMRDVQQHRPQIKGELIAIQEDTIILLTGLQLALVVEPQIGSATIIPYKNNPGKYAIWTGVAVVPNVLGAVIHPEFAGAFLSLAIIPAVYGLIVTAVEATKHVPQWHYPGDLSLEELNTFSRFPQGLPGGCKTSQLLQSNSTSLFALE